MRIEEVEPTPEAERWVKAAFARQSEVDGGTFSVVLDAAEEGYVVKLTNSEADYQALIHFAGTYPHFPVVIKHAANQARSLNGIHHAVMMEKLVEVHPVEASTIADHINRQEVGKNHPKGLLNAADNIESGKVLGYPASLAQAIRALGNYARSRMLFVELNQRANWGKRADGTLVVFDLVHTKREIAS